MASSSSSMSLAFSLELSLKPWHTGGPCVSACIGSFDVVTSGVSGPPKTSHPGFGFEHNIFACALSDAVSIVSLGGAAESPPRRGASLSSSTSDDVARESQSTQLLCTIPGDTEPVTALTLAITQDKAIVHVASRSLTVRAFDVTAAITPGSKSGASAQPKQVRAFKPHTLPITTMSLDRSTRFLATASVDRCACVYDTEVTRGPAAVRTHYFDGHAGVVTAVALVTMPGAKAPSTLVTGAENGEIRAYDLKTKSTTARFQPHTAAVTSLATNDAYLFTASRDQAVHCYAIDAFAGRGASTKKMNSKPSAAYVLECFERIEAIAAAPPWMAPASKPCVVIAGERGVARIMDASAPTRKSECLWSVSALSGTRFEDEEAAAEMGGIVNVLANETSVVLVRGDGVLVSLRRTASAGKFAGARGNEMEPPSNVVRSERVGYLGEVTALKLLAPLPSSEKASASLSEGLVAVATSGRELSVLVRGTSMERAEVLSGHTAAVLALDTVPVARTALIAKACYARWGGAPPASGALSILASVSKDRSLRVWFVAHGRSGSDEEDDRVRYACAVATEAHVDAASAVALFCRPTPLDAGGAEAGITPQNADGTIGGRRFVYALTAGADRSLKLWDVEASLATYTSKATAAAAAQKKELKPTSAVALVTRSAHNKDVNCVCVSPNGKMAATGSQDKTAKLWSLPTLKPVATLRGHRRGVWAASFSPVDALLATCSGDCTAKVWSASDGRLLFTLEGHEASVLSCQFLPSAMAAVRLAAKIEGGDGTPSHDTRLGKRKSVDADSEKEEGAELAAAAAAANARMPTSSLVTTDADGMVRLWNATQGSVVCDLVESSATDGNGDNSAGTSDAPHGDKAWALDTVYDANLGSFVVATGAGDASVCVWRDASMAAAAEARARSASAEQAEHTMKRLLSDARGNASDSSAVAETACRAAVLALKLGHPMHVLGALRLALSSIVIPDDEDREDDEILSPLVSFVHAICEESGEADVGLETNTDALLLRLVTYCRDWNANAHHCHVAQHVLHALMRTPVALRQLLGRASGDPNIASSARDVLRGIHAHTARHVDRMERLVRQTYMVDHILHSASASGGGGGAPTAALIGRI